MGIEFMKHISGAYGRFNRLLGFAVLILLSSLVVNVAAHGEDPFGCEKSAREELFAARDAVSLLRKNRSERLVPGRFGPFECLPCRALMRELSNAQKSVDTALPEFARVLALLTSDYNAMVRDLDRAPKRVCSRYFERFVPLHEGIQKGVDTLNAYMNLNYSKVGEYESCVENMNCSDSIDSNQKDPCAVLDTTSSMVQVARLDARINRTRRNLKQISLGLNNFANMTGYYLGPELKELHIHPGFSWRVYLLPYLGVEELTNLYFRFNFDEPWYSPHNRTLIDEMPDIYRTSLYQLPKGYTTYLRIGGNDTLFSDKPLRLSSPLNLSEVLMLIESHPNSAVPWTSPDGLNLSTSDLIPLIQGQYEYACVPAAFGDGHVRQLDGMNMEKLRQLLIVKTALENSESR